MAVCSADRNGRKQIAAVELVAFLSGLIRILRKFYSREVGRVIREEAGRQLI
jgi:hypothetical protein